MLKRASSLALGLLITGAVFAGAIRVRDDHVCTMEDMGLMSCCFEGQVQAPTLDHDDMLLCCIGIPQAPGSSGTEFKLNPPSFSVGVLHPASEQSPLTLSTGYERSSVQHFSPTLQATYLRNLSLLI
jgi:hypothetical protein